MSSNQAPVHSQLAIDALPTDCSTALLPSGSAPHQSKAERRADSVVIKVLSFGFNGLFLAGHVVLNGKLLSYLGTQGTAASAAVSTTQAVVVGGALGTLLSTGLQFGHAVGRKAYGEAGQIAKTAAYFSQGVGVVAASAMFSTKLIFPMIYEKETARIASDFFAGYGVASLPLMYLVVGPQIAFAHGDVWIPPAAMLSVMSLSAAASYGLGFGAEMGALGIGLGGLLGSSLSAAWLKAWLSREDYHIYHMRSWRVDNFMQRLSTLFKAGWKLSLQRLSEWGNLFVITTLVGSQSNEGMIALNPSLLYLILFGTAQQGVAAAAGMMVKQYKGAITEARAMSDIDGIHSAHEKKVQAIIRSNPTGAAINASLALGFYLLREPLVEPFLPHHCSAETQEMAQTLLTFNMLGLITDAFRIIGAGALRGWDELLYPTVVSSIWMTLGVVGAMGLAELTDQNEAALFVYLRNAAITISALLVINKISSKLHEDQRAMEEERPSLRGQWPGFFSSFCPGRGRSRLEIAGPDHENEMLDEERGLNQLQ